MRISTLLIANHGEIAIYIARAAAELGIRTVGVYADDDAKSLHTSRVDRVYPLRGAGVPPYSDIGQIIAAAGETGSNAIHTGYGFLIENTVFAQACPDGGLIFVGPAPDTLRLFGDKPPPGPMPARTAFQSRLDARGR